MSMMPRVQYALLNTTAAPLLKKPPLSAAK